VNHKNVADLPTSFDARVIWPNCESIRDVRDQSKCTSAWAVASAAVMSDRVCIGSGQTDQSRVSAADILTCCADCGQGCQGGEADLAFASWKNVGFVTGNEWGSTKWCRPYDWASCAHYVTVIGLLDCEDIPVYKTPDCRTSCIAGYTTAYDKDKIKAKSYATFQGASNMMNEIYHNGPIVATFTVYEDFLTYKSGVYSHASGVAHGDHSVKIIGWGTDATNGDYWLCVNSWNKNWGEEGLVKITRGNSMCGIEDDAVSGTA
jgi:cathepsin B